MDEHPAITLTAALTRLLDEAGDVPVFGLSGPVLEMLVEAQLTLASRITAQVAESLEQAEAVDAPAALAATSMAAWLRGRFGLSPSAACRLLHDVADLRAAPVAAEAARFGAIPVEAAVEIGHAVAELPPEVGPALRAEGADLLLGFAVGRDGPQLHAHELRLMGKHLHEVIDPDAADLLLARRLEREEATVHRRRYLSITDDRESGGVRLRGLLTAEAGATLRAVLGPLSAPRPASPRNEDPTARPAVHDPALHDPALHDPAVHDPAAPGPTALGSTTEPANSLPDDRTGGQRRADAIVEACQRLLALGELPATGGDRPQLIVTMDLDRLLAGVGTGTLPDGTDLSPATVRRIACDAGIIPAVLGGASQPLDLGRSARTATPAQRKALILRDGGCAFPGCDLPPAWCDAHHITHWQDLGPTDLTNLVLLCGRHHRDIHHGGWDIRPPVDGIRPLFTPPAWIDPARRPRRNVQHHVRDIFRPPPTAPPRC